MLLSPAHLFTLCALSRGLIAANHPICCVAARLTYYIISSTALRANIVPLSQPDTRPETNQTLASSGRRRVNNETE